MNLLLSLWHAQPFKMLRYPESFTLCVSVIKLIMSSSVQLLNILSSYCIQLNTGQKGFANRCILAFFSFEHTQLEIPSRLFSSINIAIFIFTHGTFSPDLPLTTPVILNMQSLDLLHVMHVNHWVHIFYFVFRTCCIRCSFTSNSIMRFITIIIWKHAL